MEWLRVSELEDWRLPPDTLHLWLVDRREWETEEARFWGILSDLERRRANRFLQKRDRRAFILGRGLLRLFLSHYLHHPPQTLTFTYSDQGKPALVSSPLQFNLSHSGEFALYGFTRQTPLGVDLEKIRPLPHLKLAQRFFQPQEYQALSRLPPRDQELAFFRIWTRKEAYLKATGEGIAALNTVQVSVTPEHPPSLLRLDAQSTDTSAWVLGDLPPLSGYVGAFALMESLAYWTFTLSPTKKIWGGG
ncbi:4'-phosphopantetheinyl transferase superfamily protein [Spirulina sp. CS-785/01]|uniref:4'-phosphopantetheinyl transferase family protein n=1 Tax=Spirulina sp. CS-785/01 TaxID=3021716 RepID=UPI00232FAF1A|nr:4'-phosphopantetheinyl transferase superfamily protein [Spirulina sp. CS-785/01]MDB9315783.1 4'-phosphopantetheinyl transferase superfamily protein [Spirulina sp. CS-785/01]